MHSCVCNAAQTAIKMRGLGTLDVFRAFDSNRDGLLSCSELYGGLVWLGLRVKPPDVHSIVRYVDKSKDGRIRYVVRPTAARGACAGVSVVVRAADWGRKPIWAHRQCADAQDFDEAFGHADDDGSALATAVSQPGADETLRCARVVATRWRRVGPPPRFGDKRDFPLVAERSAVRSGGARAEVSPRRRAS